MAAGMIHLGRSPPPSRGGAGGFGGSCRTLCGMTVSGTAASPWPARAPAPGSAATGAGVGATGGGGGGAASTGGGVSAGSLVGGREGGGAM